MITDRKFEAGLNLLQRHFKKTLDEDAIAIWREYLDEHLDDDGFTTAVKETVISCEFFPAPKKLVELACGSLQTKAVEEWRTSVLRWAASSIENQEKILPQLSPRCRIALQIIGGFYPVGIAEEWELRKMEKQFVTLYCECSPSANILPPAKVEPTVFEALEEERLPDVGPKSEAIQKIQAIAKLKAQGIELDQMQSALNMFVFKWRWQIDEGRLECYLKMDQQQKLGFGIQFAFAMKNSSCRSASVHFDQITGYLAPPPKVDSRAIAKQWLQN